MQSLSQIILVSSLYASELIQCFNQPKHHFSRCIGENCSFTCLHKIIVKIRLQETRNNGLVGLVLILHHLSNYRLSCRAFPITKRITRTRLNLNMYVDVGSSPIVINCLGVCVISTSRVSIDVCVFFFLHKSSKKRKNNARISIPT